MFWFFANQKRNSRTAAVRNLLVVTPRSRGTLSTWTKTSSVVNGALLEITLHQRSQNNSSIPQRVKRSRFLFNNPTLERILFSGPSILPVLWNGWWIRWTLTTEACIERNTQQMREVNLRPVVERLMMKCTWFVAELNGMDFFKGQTNRNLCLLRPISWLFFHFSVTVCVLLTVTGLQYFSILSSVLLFFFNQHPTVKYAEYNHQVLWNKEREEWEITERKKWPRDLPGFEPGTFRLPGECSFDWATSHGPWWMEFESDLVNRYFHRR